MQHALCRNATGGVVEVIEICADIGGELGCCDVPVNYFRVGVTKRAGRAGSLRVIKDGAVVGVKGR